MERWLSSQKHWLLLQRTRLQFLLIFSFKIRGVKVNGPVRNNFGYFCTPIWMKFKLFDLINVHNLLR